MPTKYSSLPLHYLHQHLFIEIDNRYWLIDTGSPSSFGDIDQITLYKLDFSIKRENRGLNAEKLSEMVGIKCAGLIGTDILNQFDLIFDLYQGKLLITLDEIDPVNISEKLKFIETTIDDIKLDGICLTINDFSGVPILTVNVGELGTTEYRMFFDTGAQISYFQHDSISDFPQNGSITDFYHGFGKFTTDVYEIPIRFTESDWYTIKFGKLPDLLEMSLLNTSVNGIIGNEIMINKAVGYFPRRKIMVI
jgi:hypothetical protein